MDLLRVIAMIAVVTSHWFNTRLWWSNGRVGATSIVGDVSAMWVASWIFMTVPIFFFVGGFSNASSLRRWLAAGGTRKGFFLHRFVRLAGPTAGFILGWVVAEIVLDALNIGGTQVIRGVPVGGILPFGALWFLPVYMVVTLLLPLTLSLHERFGYRVIIALAAAAVMVDALRFGAGVPWVGWVNLPLAWAFAHQWGYSYADGSLQRWGRRNHWIMLLSGLGVLAVLAASPVYPASIGGTRPGGMSNMSPPTFCIVALSTWQIGLAMVLRDRLLLVLERPQLSRLTRILNGRAMTIYLWHMTAFLLALLLLTSLGFGRAGPERWRWWIERPLWEMVPAAILVGVAALMGPIERVAGNPYRMAELAPISRTGRVG